METPTTETPREREPCPDRIIDDIGGAFAMGVLGGSAFHFLKGMYHSPRGARFIGARQAVGMNALRLGGSFAAWGGIYSVSDCAMVYLRKKEDPWNAIIAGAAAGGILSLRQGLLAASKSAMVGGLLLALIEGSQLMVARRQKLQQLQAPDDHPMSMGGGLPFPTAGDVPTTKEAPAEASSSSSWFGGWFGGGGGSNNKEEEKKGVKTQILESFESPLPPTFQY